MAINIDLRAPGSFTDDDDGLIEAGEVFVGTLGESFDLGGLIIQDAENLGSGTGQYGTFLALGSGDGVSSGFNTDATSHVPGDGLSEVDFSKTSAVSLGAIPITIIEGVAYFEIRVDLNEPNNNVQSQITLEQFVIYTSSDGNIIDLATLQSQNLVYDMDDPSRDGDMTDEDVTILLDELSTGSGTDDYSVLVPLSLFVQRDEFDNIILDGEGNPIPIDPASNFFYLFVEMGTLDLDGEYMETGGFEEWNLQSAGTIAGLKFHDLNNNSNLDLDEFVDANDNGVWDAGEVVSVAAGDMGGFFIWIDLGVEDGVFNAMEDRSTITNADGTYSFFGVPIGTYNVYESIPMSTPNQPGDWEETTLVSTVTINDAGEVALATPIGNFLPVPEMAIDKTVTDVDAAGNGLLDEAGDIIEYRIEVTNTGNISLTNVVVTDALLSNIALVLQSGDTDMDGELDVDETWVYTGSYAITQNDLDSNATIEPDNLLAGYIDNTAFANSNETDEISDDEEVPIDLNPDILLTKEITTIDGMTFDGLVDSIGDTINYRITVVNTGNVALGDVVVTDELISDFPLVLQAVDLVEMTGDLDNDGLLDLDETWIYEGSYVVDADDLMTNGTAEPYNPEEDPDNPGIDLGFIDNLAVVTAVAPDDQMVTDDDFESVGIRVETGWFGTPGFWKRWVEFYDGDPETAPKQQGGDFFPEDEMAFTLDDTNPDHAAVIGTEGLTGSAYGNGTIGVHVDLNGNGDMDAGEFWSSADLRVWLTGSNGNKKAGGQHGRDGTTILLRDMAALILNIVASPQVAGDNGVYEPGDTLSPIQLLTLATLWVADQGGAFVGTSYDAWNDNNDIDGDGYPDPSAAQLHAWINEINETGGYEGNGQFPGGTWGVHRDTVISEEFVVEEKALTSETSPDVKAAELEFAGTLEQDMVANFDILQNLLSSVNIYTGPNGDFMKMPDDFGSTEIDWYAEIA